ncbi:MAG: hypothetical protein AAF518_14595, partial [Spirochaetota bacterium]
IDNYGCFAFLHNYISIVRKETKDLEALFLEAALDNGLKRLGAEQVEGKLLKKLSPDDKAMYTRICEDKPFRIELGEKIRNSVPELEQKLSPEYYLKNLSTPLTILHGKDDPVLASQESIEMAEVLKANNKAYYIEITSLLSHGDQTSAIKNFHKIPGIASAFGFFFQHLK